MKKKLSKSLNRIKKENPEILEESSINKLSPYEIDIFKTLQEKYDLSLISSAVSKNNDKESNEISEKLKKTLDRINKGLPFEFKS